MKNKKAFTLIELLAAIVILSIILALIVPKVNETINESKQQTYLVSARKIIEASQMYTVRTRDFNEVDVTNTSLLNYEIPEPPTSGIVVTNENQETKIIVLFDEYCIVKDFTDSDVRISDDTSLCDSD